MKNIRNNRYLPFIIIAIVIIILVILNAVTSGLSKEYDNKDIQFVFDDTETNYVNNTEVEETTYVDTELDGIEETNYDTEIEEQETDYDNTENVDETVVTQEQEIEVDDDNIEPILFSSKEFLENTAMGYLNQTRKYRQFFISNDLFEARYTILPISEPRIVSSNLKNNTVKIKGYPDGDDPDLTEYTIQFKVENNKIVDVVVK